MDPVPGTVLLEQALVGGAGGRLAATQRDRSLAVTVSFLRCHEARVSGARTAAGQGAARVRNPRGSGTAAGPRAPGAGRAEARGRGRCGAAGGRRDGRLWLVVVRGGAEGVRIYRRDRYVRAL